MQQRFEYHVVAVGSVDSKLPGGSGMSTELEKRSHDGWRLVEAYADLKTKRHVMVFERPVGDS